MSSLDIDIRAFPQFKSRYKRKTPAETLRNGDYLKMAIGYAELARGNYRLLVEAKVPELGESKYSWDLENKARDLARHIKGNWSKGALLWAGWESFSDPPKSKAETRDIPDDVNEQMRQLPLLPIEEAKQVDSDAEKIEADKDTIRLLMTVRAALIKELKIFAVRCGKEPQEYIKLYDPETGRQTETVFAGDKDGLDWIRACHINAYQDLIAQGCDTRHLLGFKYQPFLADAIMKQIPTKK